jgi:hypothetical protein
VQSRPRCRRGKAESRVFHLYWQKESAFVFSKTDPTDAVAFKIIDGGAERIRYRDASGAEHGLHGVEIKNGVLRLHYTRGVNGSCSILKDGSACWAKMVREGKIPRAMAQARLPLQACAASYRTGNAPDG